MAYFPQLPFKIDIIDNLKKASQQFINYLKNLYDSINNMEDRIDTDIWNNFQSLKYNVYNNQSSVILKDGGVYMFFNTSGAGSVYLPEINTCLTGVSVNEGRYSSDGVKLVIIKNNSPLYSLTIYPNGSDSGATIDGNSSLTLNSNNSVILSPSFNGNTIYKSWYIISLYL